MYALLHWKNRQNNSKQSETAKWPGEVDTFIKKHHIPLRSTIHNISHGGITIKGVQNRYCTIDLCMRKLLPVARLQNYICLHTTETDTVQLLHSKHAQQTFGWYLLSQKVPLLLRHASA